jgi:hypothetical protein
VETTRAVEIDFCGASRVTSAVLRNNFGDKFNELQENVLMNLRTRWFELNTPFGSRPLLDILTIKTTFCAMNRTK